MYRDEQLASSLAKTLDAYDYAMIDTCSMMEDAFPGWLDIFEKTKPYAKAFQPLIVLKECYQELKKHSKSRIAEKSRPAKIALQILKTAKRAKTVAIVKHKSRKVERNFADHAIHSKVNDEHLDSKILVITQDKGLASDLLKLNDMFSQIGKPIGVMKITQQGELVPNRGETNLPPRNKPNQPNPQPKEHPLVVSDRRLSAVISNPNYPKDKKIGDVKAQLAALSKTDHQTKRVLDLNYSEQRLQAWLTENAPAKKPVVVKETPKPEPKKAEAKKEDPAKPEPKKEEPKKAEPKKQEAPKPEPKTRIYTGKGAALNQALAEAMMTAGILVRDPGVPYFPIVHGEADLTKKDIDEIQEKLQKTGNSPLDYKNLHIEAKTENKGFVVSVSFLARAEKEQPKAKAKKEEKPKPKKEEPKPEPKKAEPKPEPKKPEPKKDEPKKATPKKAEPKAKKAAVKVEGEPSPKAPTLIVAVPSDPKKAEAIERKVSHVAQADPAKKKKAEPKAKKTVAKKTEPKKAESEKQVAKQDATKKPAKPQPQTSKKEAPAKEKPAPKATNKHPQILEQAKAADIRLQAVLPNSKYARENKIKDIQSQLGLIGQLSTAERKELKLSKDVLTKTLEGLQKA